MKKPRERKETGDKVLQVKERKAELYEKTGRWGKKKEEGASKR